MPYKKAWRSAQTKRADELDDAWRKMKEDAENAGERVYVVYQLVDPRDKKPFYIGSGRESRPYQHVPQALDGERGEKAERIRQILAEGKQPEIQILAVTRGKHFSLDIEETLIKSTPGLLNRKHKREKVEISLRDEFCAAVVMLEPYRLERMKRISRTFTDKDAEPYAGHLTLLNAAREYSNGR